jgi:toxin-antitoxin system PIN domain toxin
VLRRARGRRADHACRDTHRRGRRLTAYLLDTNVLIALAWPNHVHHREALDWFTSRAASAFRTCPITETGFVRISSNPAFTPAAVTPGEALALLTRITKMPGHDFWPDDLPLTNTFPAEIVLGHHRHVTDSYLLALAAAHDGVVGTLDRGMLALAGYWEGRVEVIGKS